MHNAKEMKKGPLLLQKTQEKLITDFYVVTIIEHSVSINEFAYPCFILKETQTAND